MTNAPAVKPLGQLQLGTGAADIYAPPTYPLNLMGEVTAVWICNTDTVPRTVTIRVGTGVLTSANSLLDGTPIPANTTWVLDSNEAEIIVPAGGHLQGFSDAAAKVTVSVYGKEQG